MPKGAKPIDICGQRFSRLTVLSFIGIESHKARWLCQCDCGKRKIVAAKELRNGDTKSCGCSLSEVARRMGKNNTNRTRHGHSRENGRTGTYQSWDSMIQRCTNPKSQKWAYYGGRGISVCDEWKSFDAFLADMGERPEGLTLDRIEVNGNYEPGNCRWADWHTQRLNQRPRQTKQEASSAAWK